MLEGQMTVDEVLRHLAETRGARRPPLLPPTSAQATAPVQLQLRIRDLRAETAAQPLAAAERAR